jgi:hypothetical protein
MFGFPVVTLPLNSYSASPIGGKLCPFATTEKSRGANGFQVVARLRTRIACVKITVGLRWKLHALLFERRWS